MVRAARAGVKLVWDPRFLAADSQLVYDIEQSVIGEIKLPRPQAVRLDELALSMAQKDPATVSDTDLREVRALIRQGAPAK
jgi:hypothetical protein